MASDLAVPNMTKITVLNDTDKLYIARTTDNTDNYIEISDFKNALVVNNVATVTLPNATPTSVAIGTWGEFNSFFIQCSFNRGDTRFRVQNLHIFIFNSTAYLVEAGYSTVPNIEGETAGITLSASTSGENILLSVTVDNSDSDTVEFKYAIISKI